MKTRRIFLKVIVHSFGLLVMPSAVLVHALKNDIEESEKQIDALDLLEKWSLQKQKTCIYFAGSHMDYNNLFEKRPQLVSKKIYINDDPNITLDEMLSQVNQLINNNIHVDYVFVQNDQLKINPNRIKLQNDFKFLLFCEKGLCDRV